jgi:hypothetical protein
MESTLMSRGANNKGRILLDITFVHSFSCYDAGKAGGRRPNFAPGILSGVPKKKTNFLVVLSRLIWLRIENYVGSSFCQFHPTQGQHNNTERTIKFTPFNAAILWWRYRN